MGNQQTATQYINQKNNDILIKENLRHGSLVMKRNSTSSFNGSINIKNTKTIKKRSLFHNSIDSNNITKRSSSLDMYIRNTIEQDDLSITNISYEKENKYSQFVERQPSCESLGITQDNTKDNEDSFTISFVDDVQMASPSKDPVEIMYQKEKHATNIRFSYFTKLVTSNSWNIFNQSSSPFITKIIFDWDDLFQSSYFLTSRQLYCKDTVLSLKDSEQFVKVEFNILRLVSLAIKKGETYIITNSNIDWIYYSIQHFYPSLIKLKDKVKIISAKEEYEKYFKGEPKKWKFNAFKKILLQNFDKNNVYNIMYFGDINIDKNIKGINNNVYLKNIKVISTETLEVLTKQLVLICKEFERILGMTNNITMKIDKKLL